MPKKTKQEKIIAELRRKLAVKDAQSGEERLEVRREMRSEKERVTPPSLSRSEIPLNGDISYIIHGLRKTFLLAGLAISFELVIYWVSELGGSKFFKFLTGSK